MTAAAGPRYRVAVVQGGPGEEAEVSRVSAKAVWDALRARGHITARLELDPFLAETVRSGGYEVVFPVVHGERGEDGCLQGMLETLEVPYVGSGVLASALAMDKIVARQVFAAHGLRVAKGQLVRVGDANDAAAALATARMLRERVARALVLKPRASGSGLGVSRFEASASDDDVATALVTAWCEGRELVCEEFIHGAETTCGVLEEGSTARALASVEIESPNDAFYTFQARYAPGRSVHHCPGRFPPAVETEIRRLALGAFRALGCRDFARADFVVDTAQGADRSGAEGEMRPEGVVLLEVNTIPGFTPTSLFPEAARHAGIDFGTLCDTLVARAASRKPKAQRPAAAFPT